MKTKSTRHLGVKYLLALLLTLFFSSSFAQTTYYWIGATSGSQWTTNTNWSLSEGGASAGVVPGSEDIAVFPITRTLTVTGANINVKSIQVGKTGTTGAVVTFSGAAASVNIGSTGFVVIPTGGTSGIADGGNTINLNGTITVPTGATFTHSGAGKMILGTTGVTVGGGTATLSFGNLELANNVSAIINGNNSIAVTGNLTLNSGSNLTLPFGSGSTKTLTLGPTSGSVGGVVSGAGTITGGATNPPSITFTAFGESTTSTLNFVGTSGTTNNLNTITINKNVTVNLTSTTDLISLAGGIICGGASTTATTLDIGSVVIRLAGNNSLTNSTSNPSIFTITGTSGLIRNVRSVNGYALNSITNAGSNILVSKLNLNNSNVAVSASISSTGSLIITDSLSFTRTAAFTLTTNGKLVLRSTSTGTAAISNLTYPAGNSTVITGNVTVERYIPFQRGYRTFGHPFTTGQTLAGLNTAFAITGGGTGFTSGPSSIFRYDSSAVSGSALVGIANSPNTTSSVVWGAGQGLYALVRGSGTQGINFDYTGGKTAATVSYTGTINQGVLADYALGSVNYTLVGNPYPSAINVKNINSNGDVALSANTSGVYTTIYVYNPYKNAGANDVIRGGFDAYTNDGSTDIIIPSGGAFYVKAKTTGQVLKFTESSKSTSTALSVFGEGSTTPSVKLGIESGKGSWDNVLVSLYKNGTGNATDIYDGEKLNNQLFDLYSLSAEGKRLCIDSRSNNLSSEQIIPLGIRTNIVGTDFKFTVQQNSLPSNAKVVLRDKLLQQEVTLDKDFAGYTFAISSDTATKGNNRFELVINGTAASIVGNPQDQAAVVSFNASPNPFRDVVTVSLDKATTTSTRVSILNILGQSVQSKVVAAGTSNVQFSLSGESAGTYFVRVSTNKGYYTHKIVKQ
jgi:Secretion system C-terminal sorting domain